MTLFLIGMPGAGKTYFGKRLSEYLNIKFYDTDEIIEHKYGKSVREVFSEFGEKDFRKIESEALDYCFGISEDIICSTGGGIVEIQENLNKLKKTKTVYIKKSLEELENRLRDEIRERPLFGDEPFKKLKTLFEKRKGLYEQFPSIEVPFQELSEAKLKEIIGEINRIEY